jgi:hypothetical protein
VRAGVALPLDQVPEDRDVVATFAVKLTAQQRAFSTNTREWFGVV